MAIVAVIVGIIGAIGVWWWRAQQVKGAAEGMLDAAGKARGMINRARFRQRAGQAVLAGVDSPGMAAATLLYSLAAQRGPVLQDDTAKIEHLLETICRLNRQDRDDAMAFAAWAAEQVSDTNEVVRRFTPLWLSSLEQPQRQELVGMAWTIARLHGEATDHQAAAIRRLSEGLLVG
jgi:uncharacterized tellurite resistance protein B-like protein